MDSKAFYRQLVTKHFPELAGEEKLEALIAALAVREREILKEQPVHRRLPDERRGLNHHFVIKAVGGGEVDGYIRVSFLEERVGERPQPGEIFLNIAKEGSTLSGLLNALAIAMSVGFQYRIPLAAFTDKFALMRFEPSGFTKNPEIPVAKSLVDYIARWLASKFLSRDEKAAAGVVLRDELPESTDLAPTAAAEGPTPTGNNIGRTTFLYQQDAPPCHECGSIMVRNGSCYKCLNCGSTSGCS